MKCKECDGTGGSIGLRIDSYDTIEIKGKVVTLTNAQHREDWIDCWRCEGKGEIDTSASVTYTIPLKPGTTEGLKNLTNNCRECGWKELMGE